MLPNKPKKPEIDTKTHDYDPGEDEDIILKVAGFRLYFQNVYTLISVSNDLLTGILYLSGSLIAAFTDLEQLAMYLYIFASFFLLMRPIIKIGHNVFLYNKKEYERHVLGETEENREARNDLKGKENTEESKIESKDKDKNYNAFYYEDEEKNE